MAMHIRRVVDRLDMSDPDVAKLFQRGAGFVRFGVGAGRDAPKDLTRLEGAILAFALDEAGVFTGNAIDLAGDWRDPGTALVAEAALRRLVHRGLMSTPDDVFYRLTTWGQHLAGLLARDPKPNKGTDNV